MANGPHPVSVITIARVAGIPHRPASSVRERLFLDKKLIRLRFDSGMASKMILPLTDINIFPGGNFFNIYRNSQSQPRVDSGWSAPAFRGIGAVYEKDIQFDSGSSRYAILKLCMQMLFAFKHRYDEVELNGWYALALCSSQPNALTFKSSGSIPGQVLGFYFLFYVGANETNKISNPPVTRPVYVTPSGLSA
ncbi:hypothetical protein K438DRAFT_1767062 [Mycena galopus ATCC 62051]|nr:hypothetical protein K438DRAFT_1767062 [Mycena galopus ATCC 62051]